MSVVKDVAIKCDHEYCGDIQWWSHTAKQARGEAKDHGWINVGGKDYCPKHADEHKPTKKK